MSLFLFSCVCVCVIFLLIDRLGEAVGKSNTPLIIGSLSLGIGFVFVVFILLCNVCSSKKEKKAARTGDRLTGTDADGVAMSLYRKDSGATGAIIADWQLPGTSKSFVYVQQQTSL